MPQRVGRDPWLHARDHGRLYITPEDIRAAIKAGASRLKLQHIVLRAIGAKKCEDSTLCAFVAARGPYQREMP